MIDKLYKSYDIENGLICNPGRFSGETIATPYFYELYLNGDAGFNETDSSVSFNLDDEIKSTLNNYECNIPVDDKVFTLMFNENGFINGYSC